MKYDKKEPETMDADPMRLLVSAILAFTVMLFINGFVGSMGGFPAFVAFTLVFFRIRTRAGMENGGIQQEWKRLSIRLKRNCQIVRSQDGCCGNMLLVIWFYGEF